MQTEVKDNNGNTPLMVACVSNQLEMVQRLIVAGASVNEPDDQGFTPLLASIRLGFNKIAMALIECQANLDLTDKNGLFCFCLFVCFFFFFFFFLLSKR